MPPNMKTKDGGPAFPCTMPWEHGTNYYAGLSLRDYFAAQALIGVLSQEEQTASTATAKWCYAMADAMLVAREEQP